MTNYFSTASALSLLLLTAACGSAGAPPGENFDDPGYDMTTDPEAELAEDDTSGSAPSIQGSVASITGDGEGLANVNVCALNPIFSCSVTDESGNFELASALGDVPLELTFFRDDLVPAMHVARASRWTRTHMIPSGAMTDVMGAAVAAQGGVLVEMVPFSYGVQEEVPAVPLSLEGGTIQYLGSDGVPDPSLTAVAPHGWAIVVGAEPGALHLEAAELGHAGCIFLDGGTYRADMDVDVTANATTAITLACTTE